VASRDRANIKSALLADEHWRTLSVGAQWLYWLLLSHPTLNACGVADWRTSRLSAIASDATTDVVDAHAAELEREHFIVVSAETEEVLVRSFFRHDGILAQPNPTKGAVREFAGIASATIRGVISHELRRLKEEYPNGFGRSNVWVEVPGLETLMKTLPIDVRNPSGNPSGKGFDTSTSTSTSTELRSPGKKPEVRLPPDWVPTVTHYEIARQAGINIAAEVESFRGHAETHDRHAANWNAAFTTWLKKSKPVSARPRPNDEWKRR
jgi:hypothetical protein